MMWWRWCDDGADDKRKRRILRRSFVGTKWNKNKSLGRRKTRANKRTHKEYGPTTHTHTHARARAFTEKKQTEMRIRIKVFDKTKKREKENEKRFAEPACICRRIWFHKVTARTNTHEHESKRHNRAVCTRFSSFVVSFRLLRLLRRFENSFRYIHSELELVTLVAFMSHACVPVRMCECVCLAELTLSWNDT